MSPTTTRNLPSRFSLFLPIAYMAGIFWLSSIPGEPSPQDPTIYGIVAWTPPTVQNLLHLPLFGVLMCLWRWTLEGWLTGARALNVTAVALTAGYGILDELHQTMVPGRYATLTDMGLNVLGTAIGLWLYQRWITPRPA